MFDLPNAKRIRRDDIHHDHHHRTSTSPSPSPTPSPAPDTLRNGHERLAQLLNLDVSSFAGLRSSPSPGEPISPDSKKKNRAQSKQQPEEKKEQEGEDEEQEFEFRLFGTATAHNNKQEGKEKEDQKPVDNPPAQKLRIRLRSPSPGPLDPSQGRFVRPFRGWEYYFTTPGLLSTSTSTLAGINADAGVDNGFIEKRRQFEDVAVSGDEVVRLQQQAWPGCHLPWRVIHLKRENTKLAPGAADAVYVLDRPAEADAEPKSRRKPGKKRRVQLRKRGAIAERAKESEAEKRNRKNRERKVKRRQKAREMKAAGGQVDGPGERVEADGSSEGDD
ncbi:hypothetical protein PHISP_04764 [Aspergillus sp. HF37]|nr:hypothetical protein PHISP_04764 [Aspergillus sp. HF37]